MLVTISNALGLPVVVFLYYKKSILHHVLVSLLSHQFNHIVAGHYDALSITNNVKTSQRLYRRWRMGMKGKQ